MQTQRLYKNGNSVAVTVPKQFLKELNLKEGSTVVVEKKGSKLYITPRKATLAKGVNVKFMKMLDEFITDHEDVLKELSQRWVI